jgi:hypothetical protein
MPGAMILWHEEHIGMATATDFSANPHTLRADSLWAFQLIYAMSNRNQASKLGLIGGIPFESG